MTPASTWDRINIKRLSERLGISRNSIYKWKERERGIPAERVREIEELTEIPKEELRPDLYLASG